MESGSDPCEGLFTTGNGKSISVSASSRERARQMMEGNDFDESSEGLFTTGNGKSISVSASSRERARKMMAEADSSEGLFTTGNGKSISVSASSRERARRMMAEADSEEPSGGLFTTGNGKSISVSASSRERAQKMMAEADSEEPSGGLFTTGSGKSISVSASSRERARQMMEGNDFDESSEGLFTTGNGKSISVSASSRERARKMMAEADSDESSEGLFTTGNGKSIAISAGSMQRARRMMDASEPNESGGLFTSGGGKPIPVSASSLQKAQQMLDDDPSEGLFTTGNGKSISVSASSRERARQMMEGNDFDESSEGLFTTGNGKSISVSASSRERARQMMEGNDFDESSEGLFTTGNGKSISVSASSRERARKMMAEADSGEPSEGLFTTGNGKSISVSASSRERAQKMMAEADSEEPSGGLFTTGNGKSISVSASSRERARKMMAEADSSEGLFTTGNGKSISISASSRERARQMMEGNDFDESSGGLFTTGNGKSISVSASSRERARQMMEGNDFDESSEGLFTTGGGKSISVSASSMQKAQQMMDGDPSEGLFTTGNGKSISVSASSRQRARKMMAEADSAEPSEGLFTTGNGKSISVSASSRERARKMMAEADSGESSEGLFTTGGGKSISVSASSRERARQMMEGNDFDESSEGLFTTGNGKSISVSADSLERAQRMMETPSSNESSEGLFTTGNGKSIGVSSNSLERAHAMMAKDGSDDFSDLFTTGNGRSIGVSDASKEKAREMMVDDSFAVLQSKRDDSVMRDVICPNETLDDISIIEPQPEVQPLPKTPARRPIAPSSQTPKTRSTRKAKQDPSPFLKRRGQNPLLTPNQKRQRKDGQSSSATPNKRLKRGNVVTPFNNPARGPPPIPMPKSQGERKEQSVSSREKPKNVRLLSCRHSAPRAKMRDVIPTDNLHDSIDILRQYVRADVLSMSQNSARYFCAVNKEGAGVGANDMMQELLSLGCKPSFLTDKWVAHHYSMVVWKLSCLVRSMWGVSDMSWLSKDSILEQLKWRYDVEYSQGQRSALRLMMEQDELPSRFVVLFVHQILTPPLSSDPSVPLPPPPHLVLSDGWYTIPAICDVLLLDLIRKGKIFVGLKLRICGASFSGGGDPVSPLDVVNETAASAPPSLQLKYNGTRRAKWDQKLGFQKAPFFSRPLGQTRALGGTIPNLVVMVQRRYPVIYYGKEPGGASCFQSSAEYERNQAKMAEVRSRVASGYAERCRDRRQKELLKLRASTKKPAHLLTPEELYREYLFCSDRVALVRSLPEETRGAFDRLMEEVRLQEEEALAREVQDYMDQKDLSPSGSSCLTVKVSDCPLLGGPPDSNPEGEKKPRFHALLSIWRPSPEALSVFREGKRVSLYAISPFRPKAPDGQPAPMPSFIAPDPSEPLRLSTTNASKWNPLGPLPPGSPSPFEPRFCLTLDQLRHMQEPVEFDSAAILVGVTQPNITRHQSKKGKTQYIFICDESYTLALIELRGTGVNFPFKDAHGERIVTVKNLNYKPESMDPQLDAPVIYGSDRTSFSPLENASGEHLSERVRALQSCLREDREFPGFISRLKERVAALVADPEPQQTMLQPQQSLQQANRPQRQLLQPQQFLHPQQPQHYEPEQQLYEPQQTHHQPQPQQPLEPQVQQPDPSHQEVYRPQQELYHRPQRRPQQRQREEEMMALPC